MTLIPDTLSRMRALLSGLAVAPAGEHAASPAGPPVLASRTPPTGPIATEAGSPLSRRQSHQLDQQLSRDAIAERINRFLRRRYPNLTSANVEADTGVPAATVAMWLRRGSAPDAEAMARLTHAYGAEFVCVLLGCEPRWLDDAARAEDQRKLVAQLEQVAARLRRAQP